MLPLVNRELSRSPGCSSHAPGYASVQVLTAGQNPLHRIEYTSVLICNALVHRHSNGALDPVLSVLASEQSNTLSFCRQLSNILGVEVDSTTRLDIVSDDDVVRVCPVIELIRELELLCVRPDLDRGLFGLGTDIVRAHTGDQSHTSSPSSDRNTPRVSFHSLVHQNKTNAITPDCSQMDIKIFAVGSACPDHLPSFLNTTLSYIISHSGPLAR